MLNKFVRLIRLILGCPEKLLKKEGNLSVVFLYVAMTASFLKIRVNFKTYFSRDQRSFLDPNTAQRSPLLFGVPKPCFLLDLCSLTVTCSIGHVMSLNHVTNSCLTRRLYLYLYWLSDSNRLRLKKEKWFTTWSSGVGACNGVLFGR